MIGLVYEWVEIILEWDEMMLNTLLATIFFKGYLTHVKYLVAWGNIYLKCQTYLPR